MKHNLSLAQPYSKIKDPTPFIPLTTQQFGFWDYQSPQYRPENIRQIRHAVFYVPLGVVNTAKFNENQSCLAHETHEKTQKKYDSESVIKDFRGLSYISRATTKAVRLGRA